MALDTIQNGKTAADFITDSNDVFSIGVAHGEFDSATMPYDEIRYWALGGRHKSSKLEKPGSIVCYPGTIQGRSPKEMGAFGCNLCRVDTNGKLRVQSVESDVIRWIPQKVSIHESIPETRVAQYSCRKGNEDYFGQF